MPGAFFQEINPCQDGCRQFLVNVALHPTQHICRIVDPVAGQFFEQVHDCLPVAPGIHEECLETGFVGRYPDPEQMAVDAFQFGHQHTDGLGARRRFHVRQLLDCQAIRGCMDVRTDTTDPFEQVKILDPVTLLSGFFDTAMRISQADIGLRYDLTIHGELEAPRLFQGGMLGTN